MLKLPFLLKKHTNKQKTTDKKQKIKTNQEKNKNKKTAKMTTMENNKKQSLCIV